MVLVCANDGAHCIEKAIPIARAIGWKTFELNFFVNSEEAIARLAEVFESKKCTLCTFLLQIFWKYENRFEFDC